MDEVRERIRRRLERLEPSPTAFERMIRLVDRRRRRRRAGAMAVGVLLTAGLAVGLWSSISGERGVPAVDPSPSPEAIPATRLVLAGDGEAWVVDVDAATVRHVVVPELSPGDAPHRVVRRDDRLVLWGYETFVVDPDLESPPEVLAEDSWIFIPSAVEDRVWVGVLDPESPSTERALGSVREMTVDGEVTVPDVRPPDGLWPVAAVNQGLVFQSAGRDESHLFAWDPRTGEVVDRLPGDYPLAWRGDLLAWCEGDCQTAHITNFATGDDVAVTCPPGAFGFDAYQGAFSPDGRTLALSMGIVLGSEARRELVLIDVESGTLSVARGSVVEPGYVFVDWSASGGSVFITGGERGGSRQLIEYLPAEETARPISVDVGDFYDMAAV